MAIESDTEQIEAIKEWWRKNGTTLVVGVALGLAGLAGWHFWQKHQASQAQAGATTYQRLLSSIKAGKAKDASRIADDLVNNYAGTPYAAQGQLVMAAFQVSKHRMDAASRRLAWVSKNAGEQDFKRIARLRRARILWDLGKDAAALKLLQSGKSGQYKPLYLDLRGDILASQGKKEAAIKAYRSALPALSANDNMSKKAIQQKLRDLGGAGDDS